MAVSKLSLKGLHPLLIFTDVNDKGMSRDTECKAVGVGCALDFSSCHRTHKVMKIPSSYYESDIFGVFPL